MTCLCIHGDRTHTRGEPIERNTPLEVSIAPLDVHNFVRLTESQTIPLYKRRNFIRGLLYVLRVVVVFNKQLHERLLGERRFVDLTDGGVNSMDEVNRLH